MKALRVLSHEIDEIKGKAEEKEKNVQNTGTEAELSCLLQELRGYIVEVKNQHNNSQNDVSQVISNTSAKFDHRNNSMLNTIDQIYTQIAQSPKSKLSTMEKSEYLPSNSKKKYTLYGNEHVVSVGNIGSTFGPSSSFNSPKQLAIQQNHVREQTSR